MEVHKHSLTVINGGSGTDLGSMYAFYLKERLQLDVFKNDLGFITYKKMEDKTLYVQDIYISPQHRNQNNTDIFYAEIVKIAKTLDCRTILGSVAPTAAGSSKSLYLLLKAGFALHSSQADFIYVIKHLATNSQV